jgi:ATP-dependent Clp protease ATP-binding subunit ClpX
MDESPQQEPGACCFCGKRREQVHHLIAGPQNLYICNDCVDLCYEIVHEDHNNRAELPGPKDDRV